MMLKTYGLATCLATALVLFGACTSSNGPGTTSTGGSGGQSGSGGQVTAGVPGGNTGGKGGAGQGGQAGVPPEAGSSGGKGGERLDAGAAGNGGNGGQGGNGPVDASDAASGGTAGTGGTAGSGGGTKDSGAPDTVVVSNPHRAILSDEGNRRVVLVDLDASKAVWTAQFNDTNKYGDSMRDIQLVGRVAGEDRVAASVGKGYVEIDIKTGQVKKEVLKFTGVESMRRLPNGNTILGSNSDNGATLQELDPQDVAVPGHKVTFTSYVSSLRLFRRTPQGTFLLGVGAKLAEVNWDNQVVWEMSIPDGNWVFQGLRLPDKTIAVTNGYGAAIVIVDPTKKSVVSTIGGKTQPDSATLVPNFYGGFQILANGHYVVTNWEGHGGTNGGKGIQLLEYDAKGTLVWKWKQDATMVSSLHGVIVLDGLDTTKIHDDVNGILAPVTE